MTKPSILHRHLWGDDSLAWSEEQLQIAIAESLRKQGVVFAADMGGLRTTKRSAGRAKAAGLTKGEPDLRIYMDGGKLGMIELKAKRGTVSPEQKERHAVLRDLGFDVRVVKASCPTEAIQKVNEIISEWC